MKNISIIILSFMLITCLTNCTPSESVIQTAIASTRMVEEVVPSQTATSQPSQSMEIPESVETPANTSIPKPTPESFMEFAEYIEDPKFTEEFIESRGFRDMFNPQAGGYPLRMDEDGIWRVKDIDGLVTYIKPAGEDDGMDVTIIEREGGIKTKIKTSKWSIIEIDVKHKSDPALTVFHYVPSLNRFVMHRIWITEDEEIQAVHPSELLESASRLIITLETSGEITGHIDPSVKENPFWCTVAEEPAEFTIGPTEFVGPYLLPNGEFYFWEGSCPEIFTEEIE